MLADLRVQMPANTLLVSACDVALELFATLALSNIVAKLCFLLRRAILPVPDRY